MIKRQLKAAREALNEKNYEYTESICESILENEPENYNGLVFYGLALKELGKYEKAIAIYRQAIGLNDSPLAYQGLLKLYEANDDLDGQFEILGRLRDIYSQTDDGKKTLDCIKARQQIGSKMGIRVTWI